METVNEIIQWLSNNILTLEPTAILDIAIIAFIIYKLMMLLRRTSSGNVVKGIIVVVVAMGVARLLHLYAVDFILTYALEWGILALIILFQPELRRFLERVGNIGLTKVFVREEKPEELESAIAQTVIAYTSLSKDRVGALMVFERSNRLDEQISTGTALDCAVSAELLKTSSGTRPPSMTGRSSSGTAGSWVRAACSPCRAT